MDLSKRILELIESLLSPGFSEFAEFVFRDYAKKHSDWISQGGMGEQPKLMSIINKNYKKFVGYNSEEFKYSLPEVIEKYFNYQVEHTKKHTKPEAVASSLSYYGLNTLPNYEELLQKSGFKNG